ARPPAPRRARARRRECVESGPRGRRGRERGSRAFRRHAGGATRARALKPERFPSGRAACVAIVAAATMVITATTDLAQRRDQSRRELGTLLAARIADPEAAWYEPDSLLSARIRQWMPLIRRYPQSDLAWGVSDASIEIGG